MELLASRPIIRATRLIPKSWSIGMNTASSISQNARDSARQTAKDAHDGVRDIGKAAAAASGHIESDLQALREDFARLAEQVGDILAGKGNAAWQRAKASMDDVITDAQG